MRLPVIIVVAVLYALPASAQVEITMITAWNRSVEFAEDVTAHFVEPFNERAAGVAHIRYLGGPEVIPQRQMVYALKRGVVDMYFGAATYMLGLAPEADAFLAASITPAQARENGAYTAIQEIWAGKLNAYFLGWHQTGPKLHIFMREEPALLDNGLPNVAGLRVRTTPTYRAFLNAAGVTPVDIPSGEVYTALERGTVDAIAWTSTSMSDQGFQNFVRVRIDPGVLGLVMTLQMNLDRWQSLPPNVQTLLLVESLRYEHESRERFLQIQEDERARLAKDGMTFFELLPQAASAYTAMASDAVWARMARQEPEAAARLKALFDPRKDNQPGS